MNKRTFSSIFPAAFALLIVLVSVDAVAAPSWKDRREAQQLANQAKLSLRRGELQDAADMYEEADRLVPSPVYKLERAKLLIKMDDLVQAQVLLDEAVHLRANQWYEKKAQYSAKRLLGDVEQRLPRLLLTLPKSSDRALRRSLTVTMDGDDFEGLDEPVSVNPGRHQLKVEARGYQTWRKKVRLEEGEDQELTIRLKAADGDDEEEGEEEASSGGGISPIPAYIAWGVGAVGLGVGIGLGVKAIQDTNNLYDKCGGATCEAQYADEVNATLRNGDISTAAFIVGGVGIATGTVLFLLSGDSDDTEPGDEEAGLTLMPQIGPTSLGVSGRF